MLKHDEKSPEPGKRILCLHPFNETKRAWIVPTKVELLHNLVWDCGKMTYQPPTLQELRSCVQRQLENIREDHLRFVNPTPYKVLFHQTSSDFLQISVSQELYDQFHKLWAEEVAVPDITEV